MGGPPLPTGRPRARQAKEYPDRHYIETAGHGPSAINDGKEMEPCHTRGRLLAYRLPEHLLAEPPDRGQSFYRSHINLWRQTEREIEWRPPGTDDPADAHCLSCG